MLSSEVTAEDTLEAGSAFFCKCSWQRALEKQEGAVSYPVCLNLSDQMSVYLLDPLDPYKRESTFISF